MSESQNTTPELPEFDAGEVKTIGLQYSKDENGVITVTVGSQGLDDDVNQIALMLSFTVEKLINSGTPQE